MQSLKYFFILISISISISLAQAAWHDDLKNFDVELKASGSHIKEEIHLKFRMRKDGIGAFSTQVKDSREGDMNYTTMSSFGLMSFARSVIEVHKVFEEGLKIPEKNLLQCLDHVNLTIRHNGRKRQLKVCLKNRTSPPVRQVLNWTNHLLEIAKEDRKRTLPKKAEKIGPKKK